MKPENRKDPPFISPPGKMSFRINETPITTVSEWKQSEKGVWYMTANYKPDFYDGGSEIWCILDQEGGKQVRTKFIIYIAPAFKAIQSGKHFLV